jgi:hypothetical protein
MKNLFRKGRILIGSTLVAVALVTGCGDSENFVFTNTGVTGNPGNPGNPGSQLPVAQNDSFNALGNATLNQAASGVLANDTLNGAQITGFDSVGSQGGTIALNADGSFLYTPVTGFVGMETFNYTLENAAGSATATVTLTSTGFGRFVDNSAADGGDGTQANPFDTLPEAVAAAQPGDIIYIARGNGTNSGMTGGFILPEGVNLIGEGTGLILAQTIEPAGQAPTIEGPIVCGGNNVISGLTIDGSVGAFSELIVAENVENVTISHNTLANPVGDFIDVDGFSGTLNITNNRFEQPSEQGFIEIDNNDGTTATVVITDNIFSNEANAGVDELCDVDTSLGGSLDLTFSSNTANGTATDQFGQALLWSNSEETTVVDLTCSDNVFNNFDDQVIDIHGVSGTISGNTISNVTEAVIEVAVENDTVTISGNVLSDVEDGFVFSYDVDGASGSIIATNNSITGLDDSGIFVEAFDNSNAFLTLRDNVSGSGPDALDNALEVEWDTTGTAICIDATGNTFNGNVLFDGSGTGFVNIVQRDQFNTLNTVTGMLEFMNNTASVQTCTP